MDNYIYQLNYMKKHSSHKVIKKPEEKVENIYGVHFEYEDLCSRLLKVQKAQKRSEAKSPKTRVFSTESVKLKRDDSAKTHKIEVIKKITDTSLNPSKLKEVKSPSNKKTKPKSKSIKKTENKPHSPRDIRKKVANPLTLKKKTDKTFSSTSKLVKKASTSILRKEKLTSNLV